MFCLQVRLCIVLVPMESCNSKYTYSTPCEHFVKVRLGWIELISILLGEQLNICEYIDRCMPLIKLRVAYMRAIYFL